MQSKGSHVSFVYEAGPIGYGLYRLLSEERFCMHGVRALADTAQAG